MKTFPLLGLLAASLVAVPAPAVAQDRVLLGFGRLFNNDGLGDARDRWRTASYSISMLRGRDWNGRAPSSFGSLLEYRLRAEIVAPRNLARPAAGDRRYAGMLSIGMHGHVSVGPAEARVGLDMVGVGPATGMGRFQGWAHGILDLPRPDLRNQLPNAVHPTLSAEIGQGFDLGRARVRPFAETQVGVESLVRLGADVTLGRFGTGALMLRDPVTGQRHAGIRGAGEPGFSLVLGGDLARVFDSKLLPAGGPDVLGTRDRLRLGLHWQGERAEVFYGVTRLGREFEGQPSAQLVGSIRAGFRF